MVTVLLAISLSAMFVLNNVILHMDQTVVKIYVDICSVFSLFFESLVMLHIPTIFNIILIHVLSKCWHVEYKLCYVSHPSSTSSTIISKIIFFVFNVCFFQISHKLISNYN